MKASFLTGLVRFVSMLSVFFGRFELLNRRSSAQVK